MKAKLFSIKSPFLIVMSHFLLFRNDLLWLLSSLFPTFIQLVTIKNSRNRFLKCTFTFGAKSQQPSQLAGCVTLLGPDLDVSLRAHFQKVINLSEGGAKLTNEITEMIEIAIRSHPGPNQVYVFLFGGNNMRKTTKPILEVAKVVARFRRIMVEAQKAKIRVLLCGTIPDPRPAVDSKLNLFDEALKDLDMGQGNNFLSLRGMMMDAQGQVR
jgi:hypothetical protein